ncbi:hypothetical protein [Oceanobacillus saliphilus]|uniref:hypothetical protein n=1 Tax=Oceanobacillus saliphilus TaxID=2925834 RepID=UPI00201D49D2|nr:hypothetical protein [Oceanobacillus saliphilus]
MLSNPLIATTLIFALIALGEWLSIVSRARIPMLLTAMVGYLVLVWTGIFPVDLLERSQFAALGAILIGPVILHMGTMIPFATLKSQYKAVLIAVGGLVVSGVLVLTIVTFLFDYPTAVAGVGPLSGGVVALIITSEKLTEIGLASLIIIPALIVAFQGVLGMPLAQFFLRKYAVSIQKEMDNGTFVSVNDTGTDHTATETASSSSPIKTSMTLKLFYVFVGAAIGVLLGELTGINYSLWCLIIGVVGLKIGIFESKQLEKANSFNISMLGIIFVVIGSMAGVSPQDVVSNLPSVIVLILLGTTGLCIGGYIVSKLVKWHPNKGMPVALTALFGFPADYILCEEVSRSIARNEKEEKAIFNEILTPMLIGGFTTVTIASIIIAGILVETL